MGRPRPAPVTLVTGGARGIGRGTARYLLGRGHRVVLADVDAETGAATAEELSAYGAASFVRCDVAAEADVARAVAHALDRFGRLDGLVSNAGVADPENAPVEALTLDAWNRTLATNLTGAFLCAKHGAPALRKTKGSLVLVASTRALMAERATEAYSASKGGLLGLTHALAVSLGPRVRVNAVLPGWIDVRGEAPGAPSPPPLRRRDHAQHPAGRVGRVDDVAALVAYLLGPESAFVTGAEFVVDGGMTRKMIYAA